MQSRPRLLYLVTEDWYFCSHRLPLAVAARERGFEVLVATRVGDHGEHIRAAGLELIPLGWSRTGRKPLRELWSLTEVARLYRRVRPTLVHHVAVKPVVYGSMAARLAGIPAVVNALTGLGYVFSSNDSRARALRPLISAAFHFLLDGSNTRLIVQNRHDAGLFEKSVSTCRIRVIRGSGVDLDRFPASPEPAGPPIVVLPARLLKDKGVREFVAAARRLKERGVSARFALVGEPDEENPATITEPELHAWLAEGAVEYWGWQDDMADVFSRCHVVCLPSYREGLPKALLEAAACGRPIVTSDVPGCSEIVTDGENGLLVPSRDAIALAEALGRLIADGNLRRRLGEAARQRVEREFSIDRVVAETLAVYEELVVP